VGGELGCEVLIRISILKKGYVRTLHVVAKRVIVMKNSCEPHPFREGLRRTLQRYGRIPHVAAMARIVMECSRSTVPVLASCRKKRDRYEKLMRVAPPAYPSETIKWICENKVGLVVSLTPLKAAACGQS
jgi:hypothetical protein